MIAASLVCAVPTAAQTIHVVLPSQFDIQPIIDGAAPGDIVQLRGGTHDAFRLDKGLLVRGPGTISSGRFPVVNRTTTLDIPQGQEAQLINLRFEKTPSSPSTAGGDVFARSGRVSISDCTFTSVRLESVTAGTGLSIIGCTLNGGEAAPALIVRAGHVAVLASTVVGADSLSGFLPPSTPSSGIEVSGGTLSLSHCSVRGGQGSGGFSLFARPALQVIAADVWVTDSTLTGGRQLGRFPGASAIFNSGSGARIRVARSQFVGGAGVPTGPATVGAVTTVNGLLGAEPLPAFVTRLLGFTNSYAVTGPAGQPAALLLSTSSERDFSTSALLSQPLFAPVADLVPFGMGVFDASGRLPHSFSVPNDPGLAGRTFWFHAISGTTLPLELAPAFPTTVL